MHIEGESQAQHLTGYYIDKTGEAPRMVDMLITSPDDWKLYIVRTVPEVEKRLGHDGFPVLIHLLEYEREGLVGKETIINLFSEVLGM